jgi:hypothetical protein
MRYFLLVYDRAGGELLELREYPEELRSQALKDRFARERAERSRPEIEVVVLGGDSLESLRRTHGRYFKSAAQIARSTVGE